MSIFSIAICDDERASCLQLNDMVMSHKDSSNFLIKVFYSGEELWEYIRANKFAFELIILDIRLHELDGVNVGKLLRGSEFGRQSEILYVSSDESYAMQLFDIDPLNFLIKPVNEQKLLQCIDIAIERSKPPMHTFSYVKDKNVYSIPHSKIMYFELMSKTVIIHTIDESDLRFYGSMDDVQKQIRYQQQFVRTHGSFLVNWDYVSQLHSNDIILSNGKIIRVTRSYKKSVKAFAKKRMGGE